MGNISKSSNILCEFSDYSSSNLCTSSHFNSYTISHCNSCFCNLCYLSYENNRQEPLEKILKKYYSKCQCQKKLKEYINSTNGMEQYKDFMEILCIKSLLQYKPIEFSKNFEYKIDIKKSLVQCEPPKFSKKYILRKDLKRILNNKIISYEDKYKQPFLNKI